MLYVRGLRPEVWQTTAKTSSATLQHCDRDAAPLQAGEEAADGVVGPTGGLGDVRFSCFLRAAEQGQYLPCFVPWRGSPGRCLESEREISLVLQVGSDT
jgi:hypothetical protein